MQGILQPLEVIKTTMAANRTDNFAGAMFPVLHGTFGEDGTIQGFLKLMIFGIFKI